jgi:hypothetical protein
MKVRGFRTVQCGPVAELYSSPPYAKWHREMSYVFMFIYTYTLIFIMPTFNESCVIRTGREVLWGKCIQSFSGETSRKCSIWNIYAYMGENIKMYLIEIGWEAVD